MFKIIAIICTVTYGGHVIECTRMEETDKRKLPDITQTILLTLSYKATLWKHKIFL